MKHRRFDRPPGNGFENRAQQQQELKERRDALIERMRSTASQRASRPKDKEAKTKTTRSHRNIEAYLQALADMPFYRLGSRARAYLAPWYQTIVRSALEAMNDGGARVVMSWPLSQPCPSGILDLIALGATASAQPTHIVVAGQREDAREQADGLRAVLYPYARSTHAAARQVQVDRTQLGSVHFDHVKRCLDGQAAPGTKDYHQVLSRVRQLTGRAIDGQSYIEFEHPILDELVPHGPPDGPHPANSELLWRTRNKTDIRQFSRTGAADDPASATYYIYTVRARDAVSRQLAAITKSPHLFIIDLSRTARGRLGWNWQARAKDVADEVRKLHPDTAILALTDDPWAYRVARFEVLGSRKSGKKGKVFPAPGRVVFAPENDVLTESQKPGPAFGGYRGRWLLWRFRPPYRAPSIACAHARRSRQPVGSRDRSRRHRYDPSLRLSSRVTCGVFRVSRSRNDDGNGRRHFRVISYWRQPDIVERRSKSRQPVGRWTADRHQCAGTYACLGDPNANGVAASRRDAGPASIKLTLFGRLPFRHDR